MTPEYPNIQLTFNLNDPEGNVFVIISAVARELRRVVGDHAAHSFLAGIVDCGSYDDVLNLVERTISVTWVRDKPVT